MFIQFGHNDQPKEKSSHTTPEEFTANLTLFIRDARSKQAIPVLMTPVVRRRFEEAGQFYDTHAEYPDLVRRTAAENEALLIDMQQKSEAVLRT